MTPPEDAKACMQVHNACMPGRRDIVVINIQADDEGARLLGIVTQGMLVQPSFPNFNATLKCYKRGAHPLTVHLVHLTWIQPLRTHAWHNPS